MHESEEDLKRLQRSLDVSFAAAGRHLEDIFGESRLQAAELVARLQGIFEMHLATVTADGRPLVAPIDAQMFRGQVWFGLPVGSVRAPLVRNRPDVSASYTDGSFALIVHGTARPLEEGSPLASDYEEFVKGLYVEQYGRGWLRFHEALKARTPPGEGFAGWIEPRRIFAKA